MKKRSVSSGRQKVIALVIIGAILTIMTGVSILVAVPLVRFVRQPELFREWVEARGILGRVAFVGMVVFQIVIAFVPGEPFEIVAGYAFGAVEGTFLCLSASLIGSMIVFASVRRMGMRVVSLFFEKEKIEKLRFLHTSRRRDLLFLIIFMIPGTPKDLLCYFAGLTDMKWQVWLLICSLGRIPSIVTSTIGGDALGTQKRGFAVIVFSVTLLISLLGLFLYQRICRNRGSKEKEPEKKEN